MIAIVSVMVQYQFEEVTMGVGFWTAFTAAIRFVCFHLNFEGICAHRKILHTLELRAQWTRSIPVSDHEFVH